MNMCTYCDINPICVIKADMAKHSMYADIRIERCEFNKSTTVNNSLNQLGIMPRAINSITGRPTVDREKINAISNANREEKKNQEKVNTPETKTSLQAIPMVLDHTCPSCNATTFKEDAGKCAKCGKDVCSCCATIDGDSKDILCPECWQAL